MRVAMPPWCIQRECTCGVIWVWEDHPRCCGLASIEGVPVAVCPGVGRFQQ